MLRVLIVEDNRDLAAVAREFLQGAGCVCTIAGDGQSALELIRREKYEVMVLDHHMPGMSGLELLARLKDEKEATVPPVIMCSADENAREQSRRLGAVLFIAKGNSMWADLLDFVPRFAS